MNKLLKRLNNEITIWENLYGDAYTYLYDETGAIREGISYDDQMFTWLKEERTVLEVLNKIKRNRFRDLKRIEKKRYKIEKGFGI